MSDADLVRNLQNAIVQGNVVASIQYARTAAEKKLSIAITVGQTLKTTTETPKNTFLLDVFLENKGVTITDPLKFYVTPTTKFSELSDKVYETVQIPIAWHHWFVESEQMDKHQTVSDNKKVYLYVSNGTLFDTNQATSS